MSTINDSQFLKVSRLFSVEIEYGIPNNVFPYTEFIAQGLYYIDYNNPDNNRLIVKQVYSPDCASFVGGEESINKMIPTIWKELLDGKNEYDKYQEPF